MLMSDAYAIPILPSVSQRPSVVNKDYWSLNPKNNYAFWLWFSPALQISRRFYR